VDKVGQISASRNRWKDRFVALDAFVVRDREATPRLVEIAWSTFDGCDTFHTESSLVQPDTLDCESDYTELLLASRRITPQDLRDAPTFETVLRERLSKIDTPTWVGHWLDGILSCLAHERTVAERTAGSLREFVPRPTLLVCTQNYERVRHPIVSSALKRVSRRYNIHYQGGTTVDRAVTCGRVLCAIMHELPDDADEMAAKMREMRGEASRPRSSVYHGDRGSHTHKRRRR